MNKHSLAVFAIALTPVSAGSAFAACGCDRMDVSHAGIQTLCSNNDLVFAECVKTGGGAATVCPTANFVYTCPTGANNLSVLEQKTGFKVEARYTAGSDAVACTPGQILQETINSDQQVDYPKINPTTLTGNETFGTLDTRINNNSLQKFPLVDQVYGATTRQLFGGDNYNAGALDVISSQSDAGAQWWDNPDQTKDDATENATWQFRFISFVQGSAGEASCSCAFDIDVEWQAHMNPTTTYTQQAAGSENCHF
ncbi:MAG: hypothetical protein ABJL55_15270 [Roseibium sp.]